MMNWRHRISGSTKIMLKGSISTRVKFYSTSIFSIIIWVVVVVVVVIISIIEQHELVSLPIGGRRVHTRPRRTFLRRLRIRVARL